MREGEGGGGRESSASRSESEREAGVAKLQRTRSSLWRPGALVRQDGDELTRRESPGAWNFASGVSGAGWGGERGGRRVGDGRLAGRVERGEVWNVGLARERHGMAVVWSEVVRHLRIEAGPVRHGDKSSQLAVARAVRGTAASPVPSAPSWPPSDEVSFNIPPPFKRLALPRPPTRFALRMCVLVDGRPAAPARSPATRLCSQPL